MVVAKDLAVNIDRGLWCKLLVPTVYTSKTGKKSEGLSFSVVISTMSNDDTLVDLFTIPGFRIQSGHFNVPTRLAGKGSMKAYADTITKVDPKFRALLIAETYRWRSFYPKVEFPTLEDASASA